MKSRYPSLDAAFINPARVNVLFSPFRSIALNPDHYLEKMRFWDSVLEEYTMLDGRICVKLSEMENDFMAENNQKPACLETVFSNYLRTGKASRKDLLLSSLPTSKENSTWFSWSVNQCQLVARKIWSFTPLPIYNTIDRDSDIVYMPVLQLHVNRVLEASELRNKLFSLEDLKSNISNTTGLVRDQDLVVEYLKASGNLLIDSVGQTEVFKIAAGSSRRQNLGITQAEKGQYDIKRTIEIVEKDLELLYEKQHQSERQARLALREGKRNTAKCYLRARKNTEKRADKLNAILDNLTAISVRIEDAISDTRILAAYEKGKKVLDQVLEENGMTTDRITEAMLNVQDALDQQEEISTSLSQPLVDEDAEELERELEELMEEDKNVHEKNKVASERNEIEGPDSDIPMEGDEDDLHSRIGDLSLAGVGNLLNNSIGDSWMEADPEPDDRIAEAETS